MTMRLTREIDRLCRSAGGNATDILTGKRPTSSTGWWPTSTKRNTTVHLLYYIYADDETGRRRRRGARPGGGPRCEVPGNFVDAVGSKKMSSAGWRVACAKNGASDVHEVLPVGIFRRSFARMDLRNHRKLAGHRRKARLYRFPEHRQCRLRPQGPLPGTT